MTQAAVLQLLYLLDEAFEGNAWHSLLANLRAVREDDWLWTPPGAHRSIRDVVVHVGECKRMYENHAFGDATLRWKDLSAGNEAELASRAGVMRWLREGHERLRESIAHLDDAEIERQRKANWGEMRETRWLIAVMIQHDLYHAGEINHIRSLRQGTDRWEFEQASERPGQARHPDDHPA